MFELASRIENTNLTGPEARAGFRISRLPDASLETPAQRRVLQKLSSPMGAV
jgi:hypothetical protein